MGPLQSLLKSGVEFHWGPEEVEAFNSLKKALTWNDPVLGMYDERASTEIHTPVMQAGKPSFDPDLGLSSTSSNIDFDVKYKTGNEAHSDADALREIQWKRKRKHHLSHDAPPQDTLFILATGFARDFTGLPKMSCIVGSAKGENPFLNDHSWTFSSHPSSYAVFHRRELISFGRFPKSAHGNKWIIVCTDYSTRYVTTKVDSRSRLRYLKKLSLELP
ncbi:hypothetical protein TNCV_4290741 [Trichonephila clavipes]|nr:hypothetical protein TNCV_4290741 [Trichonephila clavipes]